MLFKGFKEKWYILVMACITALQVSAQSYLEREDLWVEGKLTEMTLDQKIGQLFMIRAYSKGNEAEEKIINDYIKKYHIGGLCLFQGKVDEQASLINKYQRLSTIPMFMGIDAEWGLGMRFPKETVSFPRQLMLGAIQDNKLIYEMGKEVAKHCKRVGININFAPSIDININPSNPVIYDRSFGQSPQNVTAKGYMYMKALEDTGVMACVKHFPGHGDTDTDSHLDLPVLNHSLERMENVEFFPFRRLASQGAGAVMIGHLQVPAIDSRANRPATLSHRAVTHLLRDDMGYNGLIFTDAMDMKGVTKYFPNGIAEAEAFLAGNDVILLPENLPKAFTTIKDYVTEGKISINRLDESIERILRAKYKLGLNTIPYVEPVGIYDDLNRNQSTAIKQKLAEASITVISDDDNLIPIRDLDGLDIATLSINNNQKTIFQTRADSYVDARHYFLMPQQLSQQFQQHQQTLSRFDKVIVGIHTSGKQNDFSKDLPEEVIRFLSELQSKTDVIIVLFGNPYLLKKLNFADHLVLSYDNDPITQDATMQAIFGVSDISGKLPVDISENWPTGHGIFKGSLKRLGYAIPEMIGMSTSILKNIDTLMAEMINDNAAPGAQILIAKNGKIVWQKAYGKLTPDSYYVSDNTIYDVASVTKVLATTLATMKLVDAKKINLKSPLRHYIAGIDTTDKANLIIEDILAHHARLYPWIGFYEKTTLPQKSFGYNPMYYSGMLQDKYTIPVARGMFMRTDYIDSIYQEIWTSKLRESDSYRYSDLGFYIMKKVVENQSHTTLDDYTYRNFYKPLLLTHTGFTPLLRHPEFNIAPTEIDNYFRLQTLRGYVHDMGAAMLGGVGGHAGLFSNAKEMAILMQMLLNKGAYGGTQYIKPETVKIFTTRHIKSSRRGLGFDMKELDPKKTKSTSELAPASTFGHTGFTGTAVWADPENNIVYIFCTNRTYPSRNNQTFNNRDYRAKVQALIYEAMKGYRASAYL
ncbi:MAG: serine hydrolase [Saprospiraceae bacterium]|nr:serine hydrolase [Saprospiraceae bacterium]